MMVKYLGVVLDTRLTWREHVDAKVRKTRNLLWACKRASGVRWGLGLTVIYWLYVSIVRPSITFASLVWWPGCETARAKQQLSKIQRLACLGIIRVMRTTPTNAVEALFCLPPLALVIPGEEGQLRAACGVWESGLTFIPIEAIAAYWCGFNSQTPHLKWG
jgi:hypothetical protein